METEQAHHCLTRPVTVRSVVKELARELVPSKTPVVDLQTVMRLIDPEGAGWSLDERLGLRSHAGASVHDSFPWAGTGKGQAGSPGFGGSVRGTETLTFCASPARRRCR